uniref:Uncharacterized protein n=1 Tax=Ciona intestinalis TaxID=7719 RepID=H2Y366_CIOIN
MAPKLNRKCQKRISVFFEKYKYVCLITVPKFRNKFLRRYEKKQQDIYVCLHYTVIENKGRHSIHTHKKVP